MDTYKMIVELRKYVKETGLYIHDGKKLQYGKQFHFADGKGNWATIDIYTTTGTWQVQKNNKTRTLKLTYELEKACRRLFRNSPVNRTSLPQSDQELDRLVEQLN